jgi:hypothetical protein
MAVVIVAANAVLITDVALRKRLLRSKLGAATR